MQRSACDCCLATARRLRLDLSQAGLATAEVRLPAMKALVVDDEPLARRELRRLLDAFPSVQIVGEAGNIDEARAAHRRALRPTCVFLDIQMPGGTGFDLLAQLDRVPRIVFTTAYDQYAVKAFEVNALDYLLKPIEPERLAATLRKIQASRLAGAARCRTRRSSNSSSATARAAGSCRCAR